MNLAALFYAFVFIFGHLSAILVGIQAGRKLEISGIELLSHLAVGRSILYRQEFLRRTGHSMLRDWNMDKVHEVGWCMASALTAMQKASKSSWFLACSSCFPVWPFAELCYVAASVILCACSALRRGIVRKNPKHTVAWDRGG